MFSFRKTSTRRTTDCSLRGRMLSLAMAGPTLNKIVGEHYTHSIEKQGQKVVRRCSVELCTRERAFEGKGFPVLKLLMQPRAYSTHSVQGSQELNGNQFRFPTGLQPSNTSGDRGRAVPSYFRRSGQGSWNCKRNDFLGLQRPRADQACSRTANVQGLCQFQEFISLCIGTAYKKRDLEANSGEASSVIALLLRSAGPPFV